MLIVGDQYRTNSLSHIPGGSDLIIKYKGAKVPYLYNRVKGVNKYLDELFEKSGDRIEWIRVENHLTKKERMQLRGEKSTNNGKAIQGLAMDFIQTKNEYVFKELMDRLKPGLSLFVGKYVNGDKDMCQEIVSATFVSIWEKINQYDSRWNFSTWVYAIAKNEALGQLRLSRRNLSHEQLTENQSKVLKLYSNPFYMDLECIGPTGEELTQHLYDLTLKEIDLLDEPYKTVMFEREVNKKQLQDIAESLNWNLNTVKTRLRKARQDVADSLTKKYPELIEAYHEENE